MLSSKRLILSTAPKCSPETPNLLPDHWIGWLKYPLLHQYYICPPQTHTTHTDTHTLFWACRCMTRKVLWNIVMLASPNCSTNQNMWLVLTNNNFSIKHYNNYKKNLSNNTRLTQNTLLAESQTKITKARAEGGPSPFVLLFSAVFLVSKWKQGLLHQGMCPWLTWSGPRGQGRRQQEKITR